MINLLRSLKEISEYHQLAVSLETPLQRLARRVSTSILTGTGIWGIYVTFQTPKKAPYCLYAHGTCKIPVDKIPAVGSTFSVKGHLFVVPLNKDGPKATQTIAAHYASGKALSILRSFDDQGRSSEEKPIILTLRPKETAYYKRGFCGGYPYFVHDTKLEVIKVEELSE